MVNGFWSVIFGVPFVVCTNLAVNAKKPLEDPRPSMQLPGFLGRFFTQDRQLALAKSLDCFGQRFCRVFARPISLIVKNQVVHRAPTDPDHRRAQGLTFERDQPERFLHARMNKNVGSSIITSESAWFGAVSNPRDI